jgi:hypothetical protein
MNQRSGDLTIRPIATRLPPELWFSILRYATFPWLSYPFTSPDASDRSHQNTATLPFHTRLAHYASQLKWKASLTLVSQEWNLWAQQFLWEDLWIASAKDGKVLAALVCGKRRTEQGEEQARRIAQGPDAKVGKEKVAFALNRLRNRSDSKSSATLPFPHVHPQTTGSFPLSRRQNIASYIKRLHIETPSMDKCSPSDLISILARCERLEVFVDLRSVRSGSGFVDVGGIRVGGGLESGRISVGKEDTPIEPEPVSVPERHLFPQSRIPSTSDPILRVLLHRTKPTLKHLTFTNYKHNPDDFQGGVQFWEDVIGRALNGVEDTGLALTLESLEVVMSTRGVGMDYGDEYTRRIPGSTILDRRLEAGLLTSLDFDINPSASNPYLPLSLTLPSLHSLRIPLTSPSLLVIATWSLPSLRSLSVVSIDFTGWRRMGFRKFMEVHGGGLIKFEIVGGDESGEEEGWITEREGHVHQQQHLHLPSASPHLKHFICSTNASEWNWETPDWIAPHVLIPEHFGVEKIGVWGLEGKLVRGGGGDYPLGMERRRTRPISAWSCRSRHNDFLLTQDEDEEENQQHLLEEQPFFMLQEQFGSLLRREAFPSLVCIRDMSWESDLIRRSVGIGCSSEPKSSTTVGTATIPSTEKKKKGFRALANRFTRPSASSSTSSCTPSSTPSTTPFESQSQSHKIRKFWLEVLQRCDRRGVYLEDWMGRRVVA